MDIQDAVNLINDTFEKWIDSEDNNLFKDDNVITALKDRKSTRLNSSH